MNEEELKLELVRQVSGNIGFLRGVVINLEAYPMSNERMINVVNKQIADLEIYLTKLIKN